MPALRALFLLLGYFVQLQYDGFCFVICYFVMFCYFLLEACSFLKRNRKQVDLDGRGGGEEIGVKD